MKAKHVTTLIAGAGMMLAAAPVFATEIDGLNFPTSGGQHVFAGTISENTVTTPGDTLTGGGNINTIEGSTDICASGSGCSLSYKIGGYKLDHISGSGDNKTAYFTGGHVSFTANGSQNFLTTKADTEKDSQYTLEGTLTNEGTLQAQNTAIGLLSVTGGDAASIFDNDTYTNGDGGQSDLLFNTSLSPGSDQPGMDFSGSADAHYTSPSPAVPEPSALAMLGLGLGLVGFGVTSRRRRKTDA